MNTETPDPRWEDEYLAWVATRPETVRKVAINFRPWRLYRMASTGQRVTVYSFGESQDRVTLTVIVSGKYNLTDFERNVFGINPDDLSECDLPTPDEPTGVMMPDMTIDEMRMHVRPDLWDRAPDGTAVRKGRN